MENQEIRIRKVKNGFVVEYGDDITSEEYIFANQRQLMKFLKEKLVNGQ